jgi:hypothetical protein
VIRDSGDEFVEYDPNVRARLIELLLGLPPQGSSTPPGFYLQPNNTLGNRPPETNVLAELLFKSSEQPSGAQFRPIWPEPGDALSRLMRPQVKRSIFVSYHHGGDRYDYDLFSKTFCDRFDVVHDNSPERAIDSDDPVYVQGRQRTESMRHSKQPLIYNSSRIATRRCPSSSPMSYASATCTSAVSAPGANVKSMNLAVVAVIRLTRHRTRCCRGLVFLALALATPFQLVANERIGIGPSIVTPDVVHTLATMHPMGPLHLRVGPGGAIIRLRARSGLCRGRRS